VNFTPVHGPIPAIAAFVIAMKNAFSTGRTGSRDDGKNTGKP